MKVIKVIGLAIAIWGISLLWPEINLLLPPRVMAGLGLGLAIVLLVYQMWRHRSRHHKNRGRPGNNNHPSHPTPPVSVT